MAAPNDPAMVAAEEVLRRAARNPALLRRLQNRSLTRADKVALGLRERTRGDYPAKERRR